MRYGYLNFDKGDSILFYLYLYLYKIVYLYYP